MRYLSNIVLARRSSFMMEWTLKRAKFVCGRSLALATLAFYRHRGQEITEQSQSYMMHFSQKV
jgi:hypothetical protein